NELATKAANGTNSSEERDYIQSEVDALISEIDRVSETTKFNEIYLLKGAASDSDDTAAVKKTAVMNDTAKKLAEQQISVIAGKKAFAVGSTKEVTSDSAATPAAAATMALDADAIQAQIDGGSKVYVTNDASDEAKYVELNTVTDLTTYFSVADNGTVSAGTGVVIKVGANTTQAKGATAADVTDYVTGTAKKDAASAVTGDVNKYVEVGEDGKLKYKDGQMLYKVAADEKGEHGAQVVNQTANQIAVDDLDDYFELKGTPIRTGATATSDALAEDADMSAYFDEYGVYKGGLYLEDKDGAMKEIGAEQIGKYFTFKNAESEDGAAASGSVLEFNLHVGAEGGAMTDEKAIANKITVKIEAMSAKGIGIDGLKGSGVKTEEAATASIETIKAAIKKVSQQRSDLGAVQNRLEHTINNLDNIVENTQSAESAIRDTDMATEMVKYANNNILAQAGQAMLAQANQANQGVLSLLG
ncbi:MAG: hypothetical protein NC305_10495, partial [Lachnospiraceae bacterium]|nr:hypothetical protein [Lachnospiraceae bacterium]